jgi:serpin B
MEVYEEGTEAAAVTSVEIGITSLRPDGKFIMTVDRPFFCAIADKESGLILFMGTVSEYE